MTPTAEPRRPNPTSRCSGNAGGRLRALRLPALAACSLLLSSCAGSTITDTGDEVANLYNFLLVLATIVFVGVELAIVYNVLRYRRRKREADPRIPDQIHGNTKIEIVWTAIPAVIIAVLFIVSMKVYADVNREKCRPEPASQIAPKPQPGCADLTINVTGYQWQWSFQYYGPDGKPLGITETAQSQTQGPTLVLPVGQDIHFNLNSPDVIHAFYVPAFFFKRDVIPGRTNSFELRIRPDKIGRYGGQCAELCGDFHNAMTFQLQTMTPTDFQAWASREAAHQRQAGSCSPTGGSEVSVDAHNIHFDEDCLATTAGRPFTIAFDNKDAGVPHNVAIYDHKGGKALFTGDIITGPSKADYKVTPLEAGNYFFQCDVHPDAMSGTFVVK
jgi:cytochrome c oxidase subunit 2